ncbi:MAG: single-stranded-DNA-specific exonuclease RecJ [Magnetococcales bacterium]|nr:single-stranded-DNA-specific exonuclease RecJ [Magnetococcales bacterium]
MASRLFYGIFTWSLNIGGFMEKSITGKLWQLKNNDMRLGLNLSQKLGVSPIVGHILSSRGFTETDMALTFLTPKLSDLPDPNHLLGMEDAVHRLIEAIEKGEKIAIFGDYDVDGGCATALLVRYFRSIGLEALLYIPDRMTEGYGPNNQAMDTLKSMGADVVITVDCGSVAFEPMAYAKSIGLDVIITDHHQTVPELPECVALVNPNRVDETSPCTMLSGAGVAFYMVLSLTRALREKGFFNENKKEPDNRYLLDLVAVSTVCDMVPVLGPNRVLVAMGLKALASRRNLGLAALADVSGVNEKPNTYHAGFMIGPRINAGGRISDCDIGAKLLSTENPAEAQSLAEQLNLLNEERKNIEADVLTEAMTQAENMMVDNPNCLVVAGEGWHEGVIGIVASRIKEKFHRPSIVIAINGREAKGSGRSISGIDLGKAIIDHKNLLIKGGGHKMAAGLSVETAKIDDLRQALEAHVTKQLEASKEDLLTQKLYVDDCIGLEGVNLKLLDELDRLEPYGSGHYEPKFVITGVTVNFAKAVGSDGSHLSLSISSLSGQQLRGIAFRAMESDIGPYMLSAQKTKKNISVLATLKRNSWQGRDSVQMQVVDVMEGTFKGE